MDDLRVVARVRAGRDEGRELVHAPGAADALEVAALVQLVHERDRVDRLALRVQGQRSPVDLRVALAVEVAPARVQHLADRADGVRRQHHRAEDGLLGVEILGRDGGCLEGLCHAAGRSISHDLTGRVKRSGERVVHRLNRAVCSHYGT